LGALRTHDEPESTLTQSCEDVPKADVTMLTVAASSKNFILERSGNERERPEICYTSNLGAVGWIRMTGLEYLATKVKAKNSPSIFQHHRATGPPPTNHYCKTKLVSVIHWQVPMPSSCKMSVKSSTFHQVYCPQRHVEG